jgi:hypothetical protein
VDVEEAVEVLAAKVKTKSFRKAVGARAAEAVETLLNAYRCGACLTEREAAELLNNYYIFEARVRRVLELYDKISRGALRAVVREMLGEDFVAEPLEYDLFLRRVGGGYSSRQRGPHICRHRPQDSASVESNYRYD